MGKLCLRSNLTEDYINISKIFIKEYMPKASGEFVKIYLYVLCCLKDNCDISISDIADKFDMTEKDVCRALNHWKKEGLMEIDNDGNNITGITLLPINSIGEPQPVTTIISKPTITTLPKVTDTDSAIITNEDEIAVTDALVSNTPAKRNYSMQERAAFKKEHSEFKAITTMVKIFLRKDPQVNDTDTIMYLMDDLKFTEEMLEYLMDYCSAMDKHSLRYMEKVAIDWYEKGLSNVEDVKKYTASFKSIYRSVMDSLGISNRVLNNEERDYIDKWLVCDAMTEELIIEACRRTIMQISQPSFPYIDKIIMEWKKKDIHSMAKVKQDDINYKNSASTKTRTPKAENSMPIKLNTTFNNIAKIDHDFELMEVNNTRKHAGLPPLTRSELNALRAGSTVNS